jgi:hypothetical protein
VYWIVDRSDLQATGKCWLPLDKAVVLEVDTFFSQPPVNRTQP